MTIARPVHSIPVARCLSAAHRLPAPAGPKQATHSAVRLLSINTRSILSFGVRFHAMTTGSASTDSIIGDSLFTFVEGWEASPLTRRGYIALSTQAGFRSIRHEAPQLTLLAASAGDAANVLVTPERVGEFILAHPQARYVLHDVGAVLGHRPSPRGPG